MQIDRRLVGFGLFLVTAGAVMVAVRQGWIPDETARRAWSLWPLILIGVGLSVALAGRPGEGLGGLVLAMTFGAIVGGVASTGSFGFSGVCTGDRAHGIPFSDASAVLDSGSRVALSQDCGDLTIGMVEGSTWSLSGVSADGQSPRVDARPDTLRVATDDDGSFGLDGTTAWDLALPRDPLLDVTITANAGDAKLIFAGARLSRLAIERNAGSVDIDLREVAQLGGLTLDINAGSGTLRLPASDVDGTLSVNAGSVAICAPPGVGLRIRTEGSFAASNDFDEHGLTDVGGTWETPGYATAEARINLRVEVNAGSLSLDPVRTCAG